MTKKIMASRTDDVRAALINIVATVPFRLRERVRRDIEIVQKGLSLPVEDLCLDRRSLRRDPTSSNRRAFLENMKKTVAARKRYHVRIRDSDGWNTFAPSTLHDMAAFLKMKPLALRRKLYREGGQYSTMLDEHQLAEISDGPFKE